MTIVAAYGVYAIARVVLVRDTRVYVAVACAGMLALTYDGLLMVKYFDQIGSEPTNAAWSPAIYNLSRDLRNTKGTIFTADWGIFNPLFALQPSSRYSQLAFALRDPVPAEWAAVGAEVAATPGPKLVVTARRQHAPVPRRERGPVAGTGPPFAAPSRRVRTWSHTGVRDLPLSLSDAALGRFTARAIQPARNAARAASDSADVRRKGARGRWYAAPAWPT